MVFPASNLAIKELLGITLIYGHSEFGLIYPLAWRRKVE